ncbi:aldehyde dehydrogenase [Rhodococcus rhodochrous]|uniref:aldehyde dehydrogenase family protein n=1 Tax=Rhodococcus rhodochrous TaxID=1829 RepID=UPI000750D196|nr:aldehyde dehydrogenase family protein [Rhodococcus rhodochrous]MDO1485120.1 aldehyde dehydrogenase [Rhodococcus rhodochrous]SNV09965.1 aldehyde dehydrogenase [Rhodococcus rhodochrous]
MLSLPESRLLIDGDWVPTATGETLPVEDPATCETFALIAAAGPDEVDRAVRAAEAAADPWARTSPAERGAVLRRWAAAIAEHSEELAATEARDVGKPLGDARRNIWIAHDMLVYFAGMADKVTGATLPSRLEESFGFTLAEPHGVCALITAWNVPALLMMAEAAPALAAGNTLVVKPSECAPLVVLALARLGTESGLPPGVLNVVTGLGPAAGQPLVSHPGVRHVSFVGSTATGRAIVRGAAERLVPVKLELGGKSPNVVFPDADLDSALPAIAASIVENAGQNCNAGSRLLVHRSVADEVTERLATIFADVKIGHWDDDLDMGPVANAAQRAKVEGHIAGAREAGARIVTGGSRPEGERFAAGHFVQPTLIDRVDPSMAVVREEVFGPVLTVQRFDDTPEAVNLVNDTGFGLQVGVWTRDLSRALRVVREVRSGQVSVNEASNVGVIGLPFNVTKDSGFNAGGGYTAMREYTSEKAVSIRI